MKYQHVLLAEHLVDPAEYRSVQRAACYNAAIALPLLLAAGIFFEALNRRVRKRTGDALTQRT